MIVYQNDPDGYFVAPTTADPDPLTRDKWLIPAGCVTQEPPVLTEGQRARWDGLAWSVVEPEPEVEPYVPSQAELLSTERAAMVCSPMQGILTLGEVEWAKVVAYRDTQAAWAERVVIDSALDWRRTSQNIAFFQYLLGYTDAQVDDLFRVAMQVTV